jgi:hypothetical protein
MSEERPDAGTSEFPPADIPTVFTDGAANMAYGNSMVRLYLARHDPSLRPHDPSSKRQVFMQLVMPLNGFIETALFFETVLSQLVTQGIVTEEQLDQLRAQRGS